jgi:hypothetical protein
MPEQQFKGESSNGNFHEALIQAITAAKETMTTDFVEWEVDKIYGENGGFLQVNVLKVMIKAKPYSKPS